MPLFTQPYIALNTAMHRLNPRFGANGGKCAGAVLRALDAVSAESILDYGCGKGGLEKVIGNEIDFQGYDPALTTDEPRPADLVTCTDVMEHIEPGCVDDVLAHIFSLAKKGAFFVISCERGIKVLGDGIHAHRSVHSAQWWHDKLHPYGEVQELPQIEQGVIEAVFLVKV